jgi:histidine triad (HIT) family protein
MAHSYDDQNIFAKILRGEIPNQTVAETEHTLAFNDITPQAPVHVLVIPKGAYVTFDHFVNEAGDAEVLDFWRTAAQIAADKGIDASGYRIISNAGRDGHQEVPHFHLHLVGGHATGRMLEKRM